jgi:hypothetical protein
MTDQSKTIRDAIHSLRKMRYELDSPDLAAMSDGVSSADDFKALCLELAEEAIERELQAEAVQTRIAELQERKGRLNRTADTLRDIVLQCMEIRGESSIQSPTLTLSVAKIKPDVVITDEAAIPSRFFEPQPPKLDKKALKEAVLKDGEVIEGTTLGNGKISLTIRRK